MTSHTNTNAPKGFLKIHIVPFEKDGFHFVRSSQMNLVARGNTAIEALVNFVNMAAASISVAEMRGNLPALIKNSGVEVLEIAPRETASPSGGQDIFFPLIAAADARVRAVG